MGSFGTHLSFNSYILLNQKTSLFGVGSQHTQPIRPKFGGFFCLCTTGPQKRLVFWFYNMYEMKPEWVPNDPRWVAFHVLFFAESYFQMKCAFGTGELEYRLAPLCMNNWSFLHPAGWLLYVRASIAQPSSGRRLPGGEAQHPHPCGKRSHPVTLPILDRNGLEAA